MFHKIHRKGGCHPVAGPCTALRHHKGGCHLAARACALIVLAVFLHPRGMSFVTGGREASAVRGQPPAVARRATEHLHHPAKRDAYYGRPLNVAQYLVDLHDAKAAFDFCGGMMFQLVLSEKLRGHLAQVARGDGPQPVVYDASANRMFKIPGYSKDASADNINVFHGREIRQVPHAAGGMGFVLQLSLAEGDEEGWTQEEVKGYDGWGHDSGRMWRKGERYESEGFQTFKSKFGRDSFGLHHRCYLHFDGRDQLWLSAEDGCEGEPAQWRP